MAKTLRLAFLVFIITCFLSPCFSFAQANEADIYQEAFTLAQEGHYQLATEKFSSIIDYKDAEEFSLYCQSYVLAAEGTYERAAKTAKDLGDFKDSRLLAIYWKAKNAEKKGNYASAFELYQSIIAYKDSASRSTLLENASILKTAEIIQPFENGLAIFRSNGKWGVFDASLQIVIEPKWASISTTYDDFLIMKDNDGSNKLYFHSQNLLIDLRCSGSIERMDNTVYKISDETISASSEAFTKYAVLDIANISSDYIYDFKWDYISSLSVPGRYSVMLDESSLNGTTIPRYGLVDNNGNILCEPMWDEIEYINNNMFTVQKDDLYGLMDIDGQVVLEPNNRTISDFVDGYAYVLDEYYDAKLVRPDGTTAFHFDGAVINDGFSEGRVTFLDYSLLKYGCIDLNGEIAIPATWDLLLPFCEGRAAVFQGTVGQQYMPYEERIGKYGFIDLNGNIICEPQWDHVDSFVDGFARVFVGTVSDNFLHQPENGKYGFIDLNGNVIIQPTWDHAEMRGGCLVCYTGSLTEYGTPDNGTYSYYNYDGILLTTAQWDDAEGAQWNDMQYYLENKTAFTIFTGTLSDGKPENGQYGIIRYDGVLLSEAKWDEVSSFSNGVAVVTSNGLQGYLNSEGKLISEPQWERAFDFSNDFAAVCRNEKFGFINIDGQVICYREWDFISKFSEDGIAKITCQDYYNNFYGYINKEGNTISDPQWDEAFQFSNGIGIVRKGDQWYFLNTQGDIIL